MFGTSRQELALSNQCICQQRGSRYWPMSPWPNFKIPRRTSEARAYRTHVQSNVSLYKALPRKAISCWSWFKAKQPAYPTSGPAGAMSMICFGILFSKWKPLAQITFKCMQKSICQEPFTRVFGVQQFPNNYFWHMPCDILSMVARCRWTKAHSSSLANHISIKLTLHNDSPLRRTWSQLSFSCKDAHLGNSVISPMKPQKGSC